MSRWTNLSTNSFVDVIHAEANVSEGFPEWILHCFSNSDHLAVPTPPQQAKKWPFAYDGDPLCFAWGVHAGAGSIVDRVRWILVFINIAHSACWHDGIGIVVHALIRNIHHGGAISQLYSTFFQPAISGLASRLFHIYCKKSRRRMGFLICYINAGERRVLSEKKNIP